MKIQKKKVNFKKEIQSNASKLTDRYWLYAIPLVLLCFLLVLSILDIHLRQQMSATELPRITFPIHASDYPYLTSLEAPPVTAYSAIIMDDASKRILYKKNSDFRFSMASTTKIMTALVGLDYFTPQSVLTVQRSGVEGTVVGFQAGQQYYFSDVLYGMFLPSGNDAALTLADNYPGGIHAFVQKMNEKAKSLHLTDTHYADPAGLEDDQDFTTVVDLARLTSVVVGDSTLSKIMDTKERSFTSVNGINQFTVNNLNELLDEPGVTGVKTGHTEGAGDVLITSYLHNGHTFIVIVMNSQDRFSDTRILLQYLNQHVAYFTPRQ